MGKIKTVVGIVSFNDLDYLKKTLPGAVAISNSKVVVFDNAHSDKVKNFIEKKYPEIIFLRHKTKNIGFSKGHNYILKKSPVSKYYFCLNPDVLLDTKVAEKCVSYLDKHPEITMTGAKLYFWDFQNDKKTDIIDTVGIIGGKGHNFWDRGQGKKDRGQYNSSIKNVFGISGAAFFIRRSKIKNIHGSPDRLFDSNIFMYKEDIDLAYRLRWLGENITVLPEVLGYHARTLSKNKKKSYFEMRMSYKNHFIMLRNNFSARYSMKTKLQTFVYEILKFFYYLFRCPRVCTELFNAFKVKVHKSTRKIKPRKMQKYLLK